MLTLTELEPQVMNLSLHDRANLASTLLSSLPPVLHEEDDGAAEALRREAEAELDPSAILSLEEFQRGISAMRGR